jgi:glycosyltransferase involved in cell wall biosynthesis
MKFAFISTMQGSEWGGSEELWSQAAPQLKEAGHEVHASVVYWPRLSARITELARLGIDFQTHSSQHAGQARRVWNRLSFSNRRGYRRLKQFNPDLAIISQGHNSGGFDWAETCRDARIPYVMLIHCNSELSWFPEETVGDAVASYTAARKVFCVSHGNLNLLRLQLGDPLLNAEVLWNPYNVSTNPAPAWPDENKTWRTACVARMDPAAKGQDVLLQILAQPEWRERCVEVNFYGAGAYELTLRRMAEMLQVKNVHFRGHVNDIRGIWEQNHILLLPSRYEGLPLALVEAMWCGRPAVVTDVGGNAELCVDGETGFVAPAATFSSFAEAMERAWEARTEWKQLGEAARARVESLVPKDPISVFCARLRACAAGTSDPAPPGHWRDSRS